MLIKTRRDKDYTDTMKSTYHTLEKKFGNLAKITNMWEMLLVILDKPNFSYLDYRTANTPELEAYLIDTFISWRDFESINFSDVKDELLRVGTFSKDEQLIFLEKDFEGEGPS